MSTGPFTEDPQLDALLKQIAAVSVATDRGGPVEPPLQAGTRIGPYRLVDVAGAGGMGIVYRAFDERLTREVALKLLPRGAEQSLLHEARAAASLSHPNLASVYEAGTLDGHDYFAMELVRGTSLRALITTGSGTRSERLDWAIGIASGLAAIHRAGWIHRDVKPENVMVTPDGVAKLLDLGLARGASASATPPAGTPGYMSPEQQRGEPLDARSDVWSLGRVLHELGVPERISRRCLETDRSHRYASAAEVVAALDAAQGPSRQWWLVAAAVVLIAGASAVIAAKRPADPPRTPPARRLTGHAMTRPFSDAALSADGKTFAYVDDDGLFLADPAQPERVRRVVLDEPAGAVEPGRTGFHVLTPNALWHVDGEQRTLLYRGAFKYASPSAARDRLVSIEGSRAVVRSLPGGEELSAVTHPPERALHAARWSPAAPLYALSWSDRSTGELKKHLELWAPGDDEPLWALQTQALAQGYSPVVFGWSSRGALLYALADAPGEGNGASVWSLDGPKAEPKLLAHVDGHVYRMLGRSDDGQLLTLRESTHLRAQLADVAEDGALSNARTLTQSELDERPTGWESASSVLLMSLRDSVPRLARRELGRTDAQWIDAQGWAQTWPASTGRDGELVYWWAAKGAGPLRWSLALRQGAAERTLEVPAPVEGSLSTLSPPPYAQRVQCAIATRACVLARMQGGFVELYDLALDGGPPALRFSFPAPATVTLVWAVSADGARIAVADSGAKVRVLDATGATVLERHVVEVKELRGLSFDAAGTGFYVAGMREDWQQTIGWLPAEGAFAPLQTAPSAFAELHLSPDRRALVYLEKEFDADLWLTPAE